MSSKRQKNNISKVLVTVAILTIIAIGTYFLGIQNKSSNNTKPSDSKTENPVNKTAEPEAKNVTLEDAIKNIGMQCSGPDFGATCSWDGVSYQLEKPSDWSREEQLRKKACDGGYINSGYAITSDNKSWTFSTNYNEDTTKLTDALVKNGIDAKTIRYCP